MNEQWCLLLLYWISNASKNWFVIMVLTLMLPTSGKRFDVVQSICYTWMFDEATMIKPQCECAGIQILCEYIISSIIPPCDCTSGLALHALTGMVLLPQAPSSSPPFWSPQPACEGTPCLICQLPLLQVPENTLWKKRKNVWFNDPRQFSALCPSPSYWM